MYNPTLSSTSALDGLGGQRHAPAALPPGKTRYPLYRRLCGPKGRSGRVRKISPPQEFDPQTRLRMTVHPACHHGVHVGKPFIPNVFCCPLQTHSRQNAVFFPLLLQVV